MSLFFKNKPQDPIEPFKVTELYYENVGMISVEANAERKIAIALGESMQKIAQLSGQLLIGDKSLEQILKNSKCFNGSYWEITDYKIIRCDGKPLVDEIFMSLRGRQNLDVRYKVLYMTPVELIPVWYRDITHSIERYVICGKHWELIKDINHYDNDLN